MQPNQNPMGAPAVGGMPGAAPAAPTTPAGATGTATAAQKMAAALAETPAPVTPAPEVEAAPVVEKKKGHGMIIGMVLLALIAAGGVGFGVYAYMEKGNIEDNLNKQIKTLKEQNASLLEQMAQMAEEEEEEEAEEEDTEETEDETTTDDGTVVEDETPAEGLPVEVEVETPAE